MPRNTTKNEPKNKEKNSVVLNSYLNHEIARLSSEYQVDTSLLEDFALFVINNYKKKEPIIKIKSLTVRQLQSAIYQHFSVKNSKELKKSGSFKMATDGMDNLNLTEKEVCERLYRKFVGILPGEENQQGYGCINGINIFNYFKPWQVFGLDSQTATSQDIKNAYYRLSKIYHPDVPITGDSNIFDNLTIMYKSISAEA